MSSISCTSDYYKETIYSPLWVRLLFSALVYFGFVLGIPLLLTIFFFPKKEISLFSKLFFSCKILLLNGIGVYIIIGGLVPAAVVVFMFKVSIVVKEGKLILPKGGCPPLIVDISCIESVEIINLHAGELKIYMFNYLPGYKGKALKITYHDPEQKDIQDMLGSSLSLKDLLGFFRNIRKKEKDSKVKVLISPSLFPEEIKRIIMANRRN